MVRVIVIKMDCVQTTISQIVIDGKDAIVEKTGSFLYYLGYMKIIKPDIFVEKVKFMLRHDFPGYKRCKLLLVAPPDFCEERFLRDPDVVALAKEEKSSPDNFIVTEVGLGKMSLVVEQDARELNALYMAFCRQGLIPDRVVSPLYAAWMVTQMVITNKEEMLIVHPTMQGISFTRFKNGVPDATHFGESSIATFISKLSTQEISEIKALQMMIVFGVEPMELTSEMNNFEFREYPSVLKEGKVFEKEKSEKKKKKKKTKKSKHEDISDFSLDDLSMTTMQYDAYNSGVNSFAGELKTEISMFLEDFKDGIQNFFVSSDMVTDLNMRIHDSADIAELMLVLPSGMILQGANANIHNRSLNDLKAAHFLSVGAAMGSYRVFESSADPTMEEFD